MNRRGFFGRLLALLGFGVAAKAIPEIAAAPACACPPVPLSCRHDPITGWYTLTVGDKTTPKIPFGASDEERREALASVGL